MASLIPIDMEPPPPDSDPSRCRLLGPTALVVQGLSEWFISNSADPVQWASLSSRR
jgi:hypothetical protein